MKVTLGKHTRHYRTVWFDSGTNAVHLIEQRLLPHQFQIAVMPDYLETAGGIRDMVVRGAPAIAATAAYGLAQGARAFRGRSLKQFALKIQEVYRTLKAARPTAVDPVNAMDQVRAAMQQGETVAEQQALALAAAEEFAHEDVEHCRAIGRRGAKLIRDGMRVLTHCNAGWLACVDIGTATAPLYAAQAQGKQFHVFCDETRPRCQGATLTAWELAQQGISHQVVADNAAGHLMQRGEIDLVIVGSDRILGRTGEIANKIGTYTKAVLANRHRIPFYVAAPLSTIDWNLKSGRDIPIEERAESEVLGAWGVIEDRRVRGKNSPNDGSRFEPMNRGDLASKTSENSPSPIGWERAGVRVHGEGVKPGARVYVRVANPTSGARNPGFDVTPPELITGIITPLGIYKPRDLWKRRHQLRTSG